MTTKLLAGLLMTFSSVMAAYFARLPRASCSRWMLGPGGSLAAMVGTICGFAAGYAFISEAGWGQGILWWIASGLGFALAGSLGRSVFPGLLMLGTITGLAGLVLLFT